MTAAVDLSAAMRIARENMAAVLRVVTAARGRLMTARQIADAGGLAPVEVGGYLALLRQSGLVEYRKGNGWRLPGGVTAHRVPAPTPTPAPAPPHESVMDLVHTVLVEADRPMTSAEVAAASGIAAGQRIGTTLAALRTVGLVRPCGDRLWAASTTRRAPKRPDGLRMAHGAGHRHHDCERERECMDDAVRHIAGAAHCPRDCADYVAMPERRADGWGRRDAPVGGVSGTVGVRLGR